MAKAPSRIKPKNTIRGSKFGITPKQETTDYNKRYPKFSFEHMQPEFCISGCSAQEKAQVLDSIHKRSQMTWQDIMNSARHKLGTEKISKHSIQSPIPPVFAAEENFLAIRSIAMAPMVGVRVHSTFYVIWIDRAFTLYKH
tara:strand:+ start:175 stop:597 length:423 start_codon:yes stop_codon:yes gene_type:complete